MIPQLEEFKKATDGSVEDGGIGERLLKSGQSWFRPGSPESQPAVNIP